MKTGKYLFIKEAFGEDVYWVFIERFRLKGAYHLGFTIEEENGKNLYFVKDTKPWQWGDKL